MTIKGIFVECVKVQVVSMDIQEKKAWAAIILAKTYQVNEDKLSLAFINDWHSDYKLIGSMAYNYVKSFYHDSYKRDWME